MKAVRVHAYGGPENLLYEDIPEPSCQSQEVKIEIKACGMNHLDLWVRKGLPGLRITLPHILGSDISGVIREVASDVQSFKVNDEVLVSPNISCGSCEHCLEGFDNYCHTWKLIGEHVNGGNCELIAVHQSNLVLKPKSLSFEQAAAIPVNFMTAWHMLVTQGHIGPGQTVLIHAAGSGVGSVGIQIAKAFGATVIATASSSEKLAKAEALGANYLINYEKEDFQTKVREITQKRGVDIVFEHTGPKTFEGSYKSLRIGGRLVTCGATTGPEVKLDLRYVFARQLQIIGCTLGRKADLFEILKLASEGRLKPILDRSFPLKQAREAHEYLESRQQFGKVLLIP